MNFLAVCALILSIGFVGCSKDGDEEGLTPPPSISGKGSLVVSFKSNDLKTKAISQTATTKEKDLKAVHVFIYKSNGTLERVVKFDRADFTNSVNPDLYTLRSENKIEGLEVGEKKVSLGINLPETLVSEIQSAASAGMTSAYERTVAELSHEINGYVMFSNSKPANVVVENTATTGPFSVDRVVAKASVKTKPGISMNVAGGKIESILYDIQNINNEFYPIAPSTFNKATINQSIPTTFKLVEAMPVSDEDDLNHSYMTEYIPSLPLADDSYPTYVRIRCAFVPTQYIIDETGTISNNAYAGKEFWTLPLKDGTVAYFISETVAKNYFDNNTALLNNPEGKSYNALVSVYADGNVDYGVFLHKTANKFDVVRNSYYIITITGINGLGEPSTTPQINPKEKGSLVSFELEINDWEGVESDDEQIS